MVEARTILWYFVFVGCAINYLVCINLNIAIVEMIAPSHTGLANIQHLAQLESAVLNSTLTNFNSTNGIYNRNISMPYDEAKSNGSTALDPMHEIPLKSNQFHWNEKEQAIALGSLFWSYCISQIPGGVYARKYGTKLVFGVTNVLSCWICFFIPMAAKADLYVLVVLRLLQGLLTGVAWPSMHHMAAKWIPPNERSKFVTAYYGSSVGVAVFYPLYAYVMHFSSWECTFHISGVIGTLWWFGWLYFVYDTPAQHPRISATEVAYIEKCLQSTVQTSNVTKTPWKAIFTCSAVWMNVIGHFGGGWGLFTLMTQTPTYFKVVHNWDIRATGIFSGFPHLMRVVFGFVFSLYADFLLRNDKMSRTNVRKLATGIYLGLNGIFVLALAYYGTNRILAITLITLATMSQGSGSSGPLSSMIDIAPNYAGIILGICGTIGCMPGFMSTYTVGVFTLNNQTFEAWKTVFLICAGVLFACCLLYTCFADSTLKPWNDYSSHRDSERDNGVQLMMKDIEGCEDGGSKNLK